MAEDPMPFSVTRVNPQDGLAYVWIPAGTFTMGCTPEDGFITTRPPSATNGWRVELDVRPLNEKHFCRELPAHTVTISKGFWLSHRPVTMAAYSRVMGVRRLRRCDESYSVAQVTWAEAKSYCDAVGGRLPTEAEWEYARKLENVPASHHGLTLDEVNEREQRQLFRAFANIDEWVADWYGNYEPADQTDPQGPTTGQWRVVRGHSWGYDVDWLDRPTSRGRLEPETWQTGVGFRCLFEGRDTCEMFGLDIKSQFP